MNVFKAMWNSKKFRYTILGALTIAGIAAVCGLVGFSESTSVTFGAFGAFLWAVLIYSQGQADHGKAAAQVEALVNTLYSSVPMPPEVIEALKQMNGIAKVIDKDGEK